jgi:hypothetical protein
MMPVRHRTFFPPSPLTWHHHPADDDHGLEAQATNFSDWPSGKLYPVTAAQLLSILTRFLAPIHFSKLAKNWNED